MRQDLLGEQHEDIDQSREALAWAERRISEQQQMAPGTNGLEFKNGQ